MSYAQLIAEHDPSDDALVLAEIRSVIAAGDLSTLKARDVRQELEKSFGPAIHERKKWISKQITAIVQETGPEAEAEAEARRAKVAKGATLPPEPGPGESVTRVVVRLPSGRRMDRRFHKSDALGLVVDWVS